MESSQHFLDSIIDQFFKLVQEKESNNFDHRRFKPELQDHFRANYHRQYLNFLFNHYQKLFATYLLLADRQSKDLFIRLILFRLLGHTHVRIKQYDWNYLEQLFEGLSRYETGRSAINQSFDKLPGVELVHYSNYPFEGHAVNLDCARGALVDFFIERQYDYLRGARRITVEAGDHVIDAGACMGEATVKFALLAGPKGHVHALDPLPQHLELIDLNSKQNGLSDCISIHSFGVSDHPNGVSALKLAAASGRLAPGFKVSGLEDQIPLISIDAFAEQRRLERINFIKMDIEGFELSALKGSRKTINRDKPKLAISLYHKDEDFFTIPHYLASQFPFYQFYLDHYTIHQEETVLYAIAA